MKRLAVVVVLMLGLLVSLFATPRAASLFGISSPNTGYFTGGYDNNGERVYQNGIVISGATETEEVNNFIAKLNSMRWTTQQNNVGTAFIVNTMLGRDTPGNATREALSSDMEDLHARLLAFVADGGTITRVNAYSYTKNTYYQDSINGGDNAWYWDAGAQPTYVFAKGGVEYYALKEICANPVGDHPGIPLPRQWSATPNSTVNRSTAMPGEVVTFTHTIRNNGPDPTTSINWEVESRLNGGGWSTINSGAQSSLGNGAVSTVWAPNFTIPTTANHNDVFCRRLSISPRAWNDATANSSTACVTAQLDYNLTPTISTTTAVVPPGGTVPSITAQVINGGPTISNSDITSGIVRFVVPSGDGYTITGMTHSSINPAGAFHCDVADDVAATNQYCAALYTGTGRYPTGTTLMNAIASDSLASLPVVPGDRVCYVAMVNKYEETRGATDWRSSIPVCVLIARVPQVQVTGGDVRVGRDSTNTSTIVTSRFGDTNRAYGSWAEYALLAPEAIDSVSGAALATPASRDLTLSSTPQTALTFANNSLPVGSFGASATGSTPDLVAQYNTASTWAHDTITTSPITDLTVGGAGARVQTVSTVGGDAELNYATPLPAGYARVLVVPGTLRITHDLVYEDTPISDSTMLPQLIISAANIIIDPSVQRIDAWLIASDTISTCLESSGVTYYSDLNTATCDQPLVVNGPIQAAHLLLRRTYGRDSASDADRSAPAEQLNFRSDAYLWAYGQSRANQRISTMAVREMAPRF